MKLREILEGKAVFNSTQDLQKAWEWFEHNILDGVELKWDDEEGCYVNQNDIKVRNIPGDIVSIMETFAESDNGRPIIKWKQNNASMTAEGSKYQHCVNITMKSDNGYVIMGFDYDMGEVYAIRYLSPRITYTADSL